MSPRRNDPWMSPYGELPGLALTGGHDTLEIRNHVAEAELTPGERIIWWHHADSPPAGLRPKGGRCGGGNLVNHTIAWPDPDDPTTLSIAPSLGCRMCGRHIFIRAGLQVQDLNNAHEEQP